MALGLGMGMKEEEEGIIYGKAIGDEDLLGE